MPFNEKGEFMRSEPNPRRPSMPRIRRDQLRRPAPGRSRIANGNNQPRQQPTASPTHEAETSSGCWQVLGISLFVLLGIAAVIGAIWLLVIFQHRVWILIGCFALFLLWLLGSKI